MADPLNEAWVVEDVYLEITGPEWVSESVQRWSELEPGTVPVMEFINATTCVVSMLLHIGATRTKFIRDDLNSRLEQVRTRYDALGRSPETVDELVLQDGTARDPMKHIKRGLSFIGALLREFCNDSSASLRSAASDAYSATLGRFHGWGTRSAVKVALYALPSRSTFLETLAPGDHDAGLVGLIRLVGLIAPHARSLNDLYAAHGFDDAMDVVFEVDA